MNRIVIYCRVSTEDQGRYGHPLDRQERLCREWASLNGYVVVKVFREDYTGTVIDRPMLNQAFALLENEEADGLICHVDDRLSRKLAHRILLREELFRMGKELIFQNSGKVSNNPDDIFTDNIRN